MLRIVGHVDARSGVLGRGRGRTFVRAGRRRSEGQQKQCRNARGAPASAEEARQVSTTGDQPRDATEQRDGGEAQRADGRRVPGGRVGDGESDRERSDRAERERRAETAARAKSHCRAQPDCAT